MASVQTKDTKSNHTNAEAQDITIDLIMSEDCEECNSSEESGSLQQDGVNGFNAEARSVQAGFVSGNTPLPPAIYHNRKFFSTRYPDFILNNLENRNSSSNRYPDSIHNNLENSLPTNNSLGTWRHSLPEEGSGAMVVLPNGLVSLFAHPNISVEMNADGAIRIYSTKMRIAVAVNAEGNLAGMLHPKGCVYQRDGIVYVTTWDSNLLKQYAKIWKHGVKFTNDKSSLTFLIDEAGTRTTSNGFRDILYDFTMSILTEKARVGPKYVENCVRIVDSVNYGTLKNGNHRWISNNIRIVRSAQDDVIVSRDNCNTLLKINADGRTRITTPHLHCSASNGHTPHLFVRTDGKRVYCDTKKFAAKYGTRSAGFDCFNKFTIF